MRIATEQERNVMGLNAERTPVEWFAAAARSYLEEHQGCPCCHDRHCVFRSEWSDRDEYYCTACDFSACHDRQTGRYFTTAEHGRERPSAVLDGRSQLVD
jgi:hypothetical protein